VLLDVTEIVALTLSAIGTYNIGVEAGTQEKLMQTRVPCYLAQNEIQYIF
jgi:hypothetical protein